ncbi:MAG: hypothetical protein A2074_04580 [Candidatus Aquicultor primus]|uniref:DUF1905 domain-containing protein n=1 Tax=Candidatus Aquicultor primus TaxID=1797195 RepID=A0A1F2UIC8_9ACTN|nr:MAG: hypothetical protein A2074_04580 [Candidatus Aquicultor primus]
MTIAREHTFTADMRIAGINPYVDVPPHVVKALGSGSKVPVLVKVSAASAGKRKSADAQAKRRLRQDATRLKMIGRLAPGGWFRSTVLILHSSAPRLYLDSWMRETAGVAVGDRVRVSLRLDCGSRELPMPAALREALDGNEQAHAAWERLTPSRRREILTYLHFLKTPTAIERNVQKQSLFWSPGTGTMTNW